MARSIRAPKLENRTGRLKLPISKKPVFVRIGDGLSLGYRRNATAGTWVMRIADGAGGYKTKAMGSADDFADADGVNVLTFWEAQDRARALAAPSAGFTEAPVLLTVKAAVDTYLERLETKNPATARDTRQRLAKHVLPKLGGVLVKELTKTQIERWQAGMVRKGPDTETVRRSKDTANRVLSMLRAALNLAAADAAHGLSDAAWRHVKAFPRVGAPREVHWTGEQVAELIDAASPEFADLIRAGFLTGARYGELAGADVRDFDAAGGVLTIRQGKTGARAIILHREAVQFFEGATVGRDGDEPLIPRAGGARWGKSHQHRPMKAALLAAALDPDGTFYALRHSYISRAIEGGVPLTVIAENCGTSIRMIEKTYGKVLAAKRREFLERGAPSLAGRVVKLVARA
ncbi:tyrosine-type recombinase/integrase [Niveispirillum sp. KHB5.9]|uniref:tyrosine-type recombinase/integrase n=1 Tax=Niveispirillum sp. KHB5.9 TaxID=3400269 RepID=UPI003A898165